MYVCMYVCVYVCMYMYVHVCVYVCMYIPIRMYIHTYVHMYVQYVCILCTYYTKYPCISNEDISHCMLPHTHNCVYTLHSYMYHCLLVRAELAYYICLCGMKAAPLSLLVVMCDIIYKKCAYCEC